MPKNTTNPLDAQLPKKRAALPKSSPRRLAANRANAQRSTGPRTEAGKKKAALNAIRHGLLARMTILTYESKANFENVAQHYHTHFQPIDNIEANYVDEMASTYWRLLRLRAMETQLLNRAVLRETSHDVMDRCLNGLVAAADNGTLELFMRYESHLSRAHHRAYRLLRDMQKNRTPVTPELPEVMIEPILPLDPKPQQTPPAPQQAPQPAAPAPAATQTQDHVQPENTNYQTKPLKQSLTSSGLSANRTNAGTHPHATPARQSVRNVPPHQSNEPGTGKDAKPVKAA